MKSFTMFLVILLAVAGCATCKNDAIKNATKWQEKGYQTEIVAYTVGIDGKISGLGIWESHVEARVFYEGQWKWVSKYGILKDKADYSTTSDSIAIWQLDQFKKLLAGTDNVEFKYWYCDEFVTATTNLKIGQEYANFVWNQKLSCEQKYGPGAYEKYFKMPEGYVFRNETTNAIKQVAWWLLVLAI